MFKERWKEVPGTNGLLLISDMGRRSRLNKGKTYCKIPMESKSRRYSYAIVNGKPKGIHVIVMLAFMGDRPEGMVVNHIDGNPSNNALSNLEYVTCAQDTIHSMSDIKISAKLINPMLFNWPPEIAPDYIVKFYDSIPKNKKYRFLNRIKGCSDTRVLQYCKGRPIPKRVADVIKPLILKEVLNRP